MRTRHQRRKQVHDLDHDDGDDIVADGGHRSVSCTKPGPVSGVAHHVGNRVACCPSASEVVTDFFLRAVQRRQFITLLGGAAAWPLTARAAAGDARDRLP